MTVKARPATQVDLVGGSGVARHISLALDEGGRPIVAAWRDVGTPEARLTFSRRDSDRWRTRVVVRTSGGGYCSLATDRDGAPVIAYADLDTSTVMLARATADGADWVIETVADGALGLAASGPAVVVSADGQPEVCFASDEGPRLAVRAETGDWATQLLDPAASMGADVAYAAGPAGERHVLSRDPLSDSLVHLAEADGTWQRHELPWRGDPQVPGFLGDGPALAVDARGRPHAAFWTHEGIRHASLAENGVWTSTVVVPDGAAGPGPAIAIEPNGHPVIACPNASGGVEMARRDEEGWERETVGAGSEPRRAAGTVALALDARGATHVAFVDDHTGEVCTVLLPGPGPERVLHVSTSVDTALHGSVSDASVRRVKTDAVVPPAHGRLVLKSGGAFTYIPERGYHGADRFDYAVAGGRGAGEVGSVRISVEVPILLRVVQRPFPQRQKRSTSEVALPSRVLRGYTVALQRRQEGEWIDQRHAGTVRLAQLLRPPKQQGPPGPYRLELRDAQRRYPVARSDTYPRPPSHGVAVVLDGDLSALLALRSPRFDPEAGEFGPWPRKARKPRLREQATGDAVRYLQGVIFHRTGGHIVIDGFYGHETELRVTELQRSRRIEVDGVVGPRTWRVIDRLAGG